MDCSFSGEWGVMGMGNIVSVYRCVHLRAGGGEAGDEAGHKM